MIPRCIRDPLDWNCIKLVVFDVDGTLYNQHALRVRMARDVFFYSLVNRSFKVISVIRAYRRIRERLANEEAHYLEAALVEKTAMAVGCSPEAVKSIVTEWIELRPLSYLATCRYPGVVELFLGLRRNGKMIGILSDYPAHSKLAALGLVADHVVTAGDNRIGFQKPHTRGLEFLITAAGVNAAATLLIGDRRDRDGLVARRVGAQALILSSSAIKGWRTFRRYDGPLFAPLTTDCA